VIHIGLQTRTQAEVKDGLKAGDRVLSTAAGQRRAGEQSAARNANRFNRGPQL
jgi:hypothetical protein